MTRLSNTYLITLTILLSMFGGTACSSDETASSNTEEPTTDEETERERDENSDDDDDSGETSEENDNNQEDDTPPVVTCNYPQESIPFVNYGDVIPNLEFSEVYLADRSRSTFSFKDFYCSPEYEQYDSMTLILVADWCAPCNDYMKAIDDFYHDALLASNTLPVFIDLQNVFYQPASTLAAYRKVTPYVTPGLGIIAGMADSNIQAMFDTGFYTFTPYSAVIRKSDMKVIAKENSQNGRMLLVESLMNVVNDLDADWQSALGAPPPPPPFMSNCAEGQEETSEPNNLPEEATTLTAGTYQGGICGEPAVDMYYVEDGDWTVNLLFSNAQGDLDMALFRTPESTEFEVVSDSVDDNESISFTGAGYIYIGGYQNASAPYTLELINAASENAGGEG